MGLLRSTFRRALPFSRVGAALWAWQHRDQIAGWAGWAARSAPRLIAGDTKDVVTEGRLRARLSTDSRTRDVDGLQVEVADGVAVLQGAVEASAHDAAVSIAADASGVRRVRDELRDKDNRRRR